MFCCVFPLCCLFSLDWSGHLTYLLQENKLLSAPFGVKIHTYIFLQSSRPSRVQYAPCTYVGLSLFCFCNCLLPAGFFILKLRLRIRFFFFFYVFIWHKEEDINLLIYNTTLYSCIQSTWFNSFKCKSFRTNYTHCFSVPKKKKKHPLFFREYIQLS